MPRFFRKINLISSEIRAVFQPKDVEDAPRRPARAASELHGIRHRYAADLCLVALVRAVQQSSALSADNIRTALQYLDLDYSEFVQVASLQLAPSEALKTLVFGRPNDLAFNQLFSALTDLSIDDEPTAVSLLAQLRLYGTFDDCLLKFSRTTGGRERAYLAAEFVDILRSHGESDGAIRRLVVGAGEFIRRITTDDNHRRIQFELNPRHSAQTADKLTEALFDSGVCFGTLLDIEAVGETLRSTDVFCVARAVQRSSSEYADVARVLESPTLVKAARLGLLNSIPEEFLRASNQKSLL